LFCTNFKTHTSGTSVLFDTYTYYSYYYYSENESARGRTPLSSPLLSLSLLSLSLSLFKATFIIKGEERKREFDRIGETLNNVLISAI